MKLHGLFGVVVLAVLMLVASCGQVDFTAPTGSKITMTVQPQTVAANGIANITVVGTRANGAPLPDGTVVRFTSDLGSIDPNPVDTKDGVALSRFRAGTRSGEATITASSGSAPDATVKIKIGEIRAAKIVLVATPIQLPLGGGTVNLKAHVFDDQGNPLGGIGVIFTTTAGDLDSRGRVIKSNDEGLATDTLTTTVAAAVTATSQQGTATATANVTIGQSIPCDFVFSPTAPFVGQSITFVDKSGNASGVNFLWDFGDGSTGEGFTVTHTYAVEGQYTVVHTVIDSQGLSTVCTQTVNVALGVPFCSFTFVPQAPQENANVSFDASQSTDPSGIASFNWSFGDGTSATTTSPFTNHVYVFPLCNAGTQQVQVGLEVTNNRGGTSFCSQTLTITCI